MRMPQPILGSWLRRQSWTAHTSSTTCPGEYAARAAAGAARRENSLRTTMNSLEEQAARAGDPMMRTLDRPAISSVVLSDEPEGGHERAPAIESKPDRLSR